ncbi:hypothetical protein Fbal_1474 [Ferrimonas balearica DSM 9799]|uniref:Uncharacterized protein n=2 Tax=Ferrimonas balearica TaxID=44012 RepID=E1SNJ4_FERBD|nr:hypothetical protein Fbal_1474 [Ferrimonas balearica DSM 9799]
MSNAQLEAAFRSALVELEQEKPSKAGELNSATRSKSQMRAFLNELAWSDKQLETFKEVIDEMLNERREAAKKQEQVQTYKAKLINLAKDLDMSYQELLVTMVDLDSRR